MQCIETNTIGILTENAFMNTQPTKHTLNQTLTYRRNKKATSLAAET